MSKGASDAAASHTVKLSIENAELKAELERLRAENETLTTSFESLRQSLTQMQPDYEQCKADRDQWKRYGEALEPFVEHDVGCPSTPFRPECKCGLDAVLARCPKEIT